MDLYRSTQRHDWETPPDLFAKLNAEFHFTLDPCCTAASAKCRKFYTSDDDGRFQSWAGEIVFMNPPYGTQIKHWVAKARSESRKGATVVCLIPARTDTRWWHDHIEGHAEVRFIKGRLRFSGMKVNAPFPSCVVIFRPPQPDEAPLLSDRQYLEGLRA